MSILDRLDCKNRWIQQKLQSDGEMETSSDTASCCRAHLDILWVIVSGQASGQCTKILKLYVDVNQM